MWISPTLTNLEKLSIKSFIDNGHEYHLYTYVDVQGIPTGAVIKDANEILPISKIFHCKDGRLSPFTDWFRYEMIYQNGGYWVDLDYVCLKPFDLKQEMVYCYDDGGAIWNAVLKFPKGNLIMREMADLCATTIKNTKPAKIRYAQFYYPLTEILQRHNLFDKALPTSQFFPLETVPMTHIFESGGGYLNAAYGMHIANGLTRHIADFQPKFSTDANFPPDSVYETLKRKHNIAKASDIHITHAETAQAFINFRNHEIHKKDTKKSKLIKKAGLVLALVFLVGVVVGWVL